jgi:hypothetical protein
MAKAYRARILRLHFLDIENSSAKQSTIVEK